MARPSSPNLLVVTGTDTAVGKTHISQGLLRSLCRTGRAVAPLKLIETGCQHHGDILLPSDGLALARAASLDHALDQISPERFEFPAAPITAARRSNRVLRFEALANHVKQLADLSPRILLESAGGLLVPIGPEGTFGDFLHRLYPHVPVVLVARDALGTLNHVLLTAEAVLRRGLTLAAVILNAIGPEPVLLDHARELQALLPAVQIHGPLPWLETPEPDAIADTLATAGLDATRIEALWTPRHPPPTRP